MVGCRYTSALLAALLLLPPVAAAERDSPVGLAGESRAAATRLEEARKHIAAKEWAEAIADLQNVLGDTDDDLVAVAGGRCVQARLLCHLQLAALPADALRLYRTRVDPQAGRWLKQWDETHDPQWLRKIVDEAFCSRAGARALELLGDLAFERGSFTEAEGWWRLLAPLPSTNGQDTEAGLLVYPGPLDRDKSQRAALEARQLLARLFQGNRPDWPGELAAFRVRHGRAEGSLAGRKGNLADLLQALAAERKKDPPPPPQGWPTFAGNSARSFVAPVSPRFLEELSRLCRGGPTWTFGLEARNRLEGDLPAAPAKTPSDYARTLAFQPVLAGPYALVADGRHVTAFDLRTGKSSDWYDAAEDFPTIEPNLKLPAKPDLTHTLTVADGCVFARLGVQGLGANVEAKKSESVLVCLTLKPGPSGKRVLWEKQSRINPGDKIVTVYEGAPVVANGRVYIAVTRFESGRALSRIECYPARPEDSSPPTLWRTDVCDSRELKAKERFRHHLLTLAGPNIVYCAHNGAIVAIDAHTGRHAWGVRYPRRKDLDEQEAPRALLPCVYAEGRVYAAPADSDRLLCLDAITGKVLWVREGLTVTHLLGVGQGRLIFTAQLAGGLPRGEVLRAVGAEDGSDAAGWSVPESGGGLHSRGRGLLAGNLVLWPTARKPYGVFAFRQRDGLQPDNPALLHRVPAGNLIYANGCLVVAGRRTLSVYVPPAMLLSEREREADREPNAPSALLERGRSEADAGLLDRAQATLARAESLARASHKPDAPARDPRAPSAFLLRWVRAEARSERQRVLLAVARQAARRGQQAEAEKTLTQAARTDLDPRTCLRALAESALLWTEADQPERAVAAWQGILDTQGLRDVPVEDLSTAVGRVARAGEWAAAAIAHLQQKHGDKVYEAVEQQARHLAEKPDENAERLARQFPNATVTRTVLREQAHQAEKAGRAAAAAWAYRRLLALPGSSAEQRELRAGLARVLKQQPTPSLSEISLPLLRTWEINLAPNENVLAVVGEEIPSTLSTQDRQNVLVCRSGIDGKVRWRQPLSFAPTWAALHADLILTCGAEGAACLSRAEGKILWTFTAPPTSVFPTDAIDAGGHRVVVATGVRRPAPLSDFRLDAGHLYCLQGQRRLLAVNVDTGRLLWQRSAPGAALQLPAPHGRFTPHYHTSAGNVLVQTTSGRRWLLAGADGRILHETTTDPHPWAALLALDEQSVCLVPDGDHVVRIDMTTGRERWKQAMVDRSLARGEKPQLIGPLACASGLHDSLARASGLCADRPLLLLNATNIGYLLQRLDPTTGKSLWPEPRLLSDERLDARGWTVDDKAIYLVHAGTLEARSLADGKVLWQCPLGQGGRDGVRLYRCGDYLVVRPIRVEKVRFRFRWLNGSVQWEGGPVASSRGIFSMAFHDPGTGQVVQRLNFVPRSVNVPPRFHPTRTWRFLPDLFLDRVRSEEGGARVQALGNGLVIAFGGRAWGLRGGK